MESRKSGHKLAETIHSLLGWKSHVTSNWVKSVCDIMKSIPSEAASIALKPTNGVTRESTEKTTDELRNAISKIEDELVILTGYINQLNIQRRQVLNEYLDMRGNIRVFCRIRPIAVGESFGRLKPVAALDSSKVLLKLAENKSKTYSYDKVFHPGSSQDEVFAEVEPVIKSALDGYNACIFAYGQTGTGKSFTMEGTPDSPGVVARAMEAIFKQAVDSNHVFVFNFSMLEIYLGNLKDLLVPQPTKAMDPMPPCLSIQTDPKGGIEIDNLVAIRVTDSNQALKLYRLGCSFRSTASTNSNRTSSRSHCLIRLSITCLNAPERRRETNKIWFVDLGGSERVLKTKASGRRLDEGKAINLSLSALGDVIHALQKKNCHVPYR
ncbi:Kinesin-like protein [Trema orientale]|uniref:Kinesin-like protein n=1 Tax=Trema orientale TaxID=63057 RepID=A0A2P5ESX3_TREOI|nr:Kinesin-like protein [Trema orientale]